MDDQYWIKKYLAPTASRGCRWHAHLPAACRGSCMSSWRPATARKRSQPGSRGSACPSNADRLLPTLGQAPGSVSAGSGVLQGECISGPGVLKRQVSGYLQLQGHKKLHLPTLGNAGATREAATVSTPHSWGQEGRKRVFPTFARWVGQSSACSADAYAPASPARLLGCWARRGSSDRTAVTNPIRHQHTTALAGP
jgi:hypothetical protein